MFTFIHLSSEQKHDEWNIFLFLCTFFLSPCNRHLLRLPGISDCEWREKIEMCERENIRFQLSFANQRCFRWEMTKVKPLESSLDTKRLCLQDTTRAFLEGRRFLIEIEVSLFCEARMSWGSGSGSISFDASPRKPFCFEEAPLCSRFFKQWL